MARWLGLGLEITGDAVPAPAQLKAMADRLDSYGLLPILAALPPALIIFRPHVNPYDTRTMGSYSNCTRAIRLSTEIIRHQMGFPVAPGEMSTVMSTAGCLTDYLTLSFLHEYGHHLKNVLQLEQHPVGRPISQYAGTEYRARIAEVDRLRPSDASPSIWAQNDHAIETLEDELAHLRSSIWQYDGEGPEFAPDDDPLWSEEEAAELTTLKEVAREGARISRDWTRGATLIRESHFKDYAHQLVDDLSFSNRPGAWPYNHIDWEAAADELKQDYSTIVWDGVDYLIRD